ncbi:hypothetical protein QYM36_013001 [Artemia franciscana]|uniref:Ig-like domain-containing protein n=1 Tax=Artemia franciscana TaxID=6661 RepID=A0AA88HHA7_ARTSF|nr:hypothetical protein QYM36_013001 [Artemia franciscana]
MVPKKVEIKQNKKSLLVSWVRARDLAVLASSTESHTSDMRVASLHDADTDEWTLRINPAAIKDSGIYLCQINIEPKLQWPVSLRVEGMESEAVAEATGFKNELELFPFIFSLHVIHVLAVINLLSEQLQAADLVISEACTLISATKNELRKMPDGEYFRVLYSKFKEMTINVGAVLSETSGLSSAIPAKSK